MKYMGSKNKIAKHILPIMLEGKDTNAYWVEPFVGGANMIDKIFCKRIGNDINEYLIALLIAVRDGYSPPTEISKELYYNIKENKEKYPKELVGFVGFLCSFGGKWWGGYAKCNRNRNYASAGSRGLIKQATKLKGVDFRCGNYLELEIPNNSIIYCDPPYKSTTKYNHNIDHNIFWDWCRNKTKHHKIFISEYNAPNDFVCIKEITHKTILNKNRHTPTLEKLFIHKDQYDTQLHNS